MNDTIRLSDVPLVQVKRISTGFEYLDKAYGITVYLRGKKIIRTEAGLPLGGVSLWAGSPGVGKTRVCIAIAGKMNANGYRVMFVQDEVNPQQFRSWASDKIMYPGDFYVHTTRDLDKQIKAGYKYEPHLIVVDSLNMIPRYQSPDVIREISERYRKLAQDLECHVILIGHLNKQGTVKGNNDVEYLIDVQCNMDRADTIATKAETAQAVRNNLDLHSLVILEFTKNRFGPTSSRGCENYVCFKHTPDGVEFISSNFSAPSEDEIPLIRPKRKRHWWSF